MKTWIGVLIAVVLLALAIMPRGLPRAEVLDRPAVSTCRIPIPAYCRLLFRAEYLAWEIENLDLGPGQ